VLKLVPFPPKKRYLWRSGWGNIVQGWRHTWTPKKIIVSHIVSFPPLKYSPSMLAVLLVVLLVVVLLSCCCCCLCLLCCRVANTATTATVGMPPPPPPPLVGMEVDTCYTNANSSPATLAHAVCWAPTKGRWQQRERGGGDRMLDYNEGVGRYPIVWGVKGVRGECNLIILGQSSWDNVV
jgi:hypothetical protein